MVIRSKVSLVGSDFIGDIGKGSAAALYLLKAWLPWAQTVILVVYEMELVCPFSSAHAQQSRRACDGAKAAFSCHSRYGPKYVKKRQARVAPSRESPHIYLQRGINSLHCTHIAVNSTSKQEISNETEGIFPHWMRWPSVRRSNVSRHKHLISQSPPNDCRRELCIGEQLP